MRSRIQFTWEHAQYMQQHFFLQTEEMETVEPTERITNEAGPEEAESRGAAETPRHRLIAQQRRAVETQRAGAARILQESCMQDLHAICPFSCTILAQSCTYLARNGARFCKSCCKNNYLHFLHIFCKILQELVQDCARKGTYCVQVSHARFLQDSCMILQVRFCWGCEEHGVR